MQLETLLSGLIPIFLFLAMSCQVCKACFAHVIDLKRLQGHLTHESALMAANALVGSCLDYCNSLFRGVPTLDLHKLQCVQNSLPRIVANITKYSHITPVRKELHWLPIKYNKVSTQGLPQILWTIFDTQT